MSQQTSEYLYDRGVLQGLTTGRVEGRVEGRLLTLRSVLQDSLTNRFGTLPAEVKQQIETATDLDRLHRAVVKVSEMKSLQELSL
jgi:hypothetical protein